MTEPKGVSDSGIINKVKKTRQKRNISTSVKIKNLNKRKKLNEEAEDQNMFMEDQPMDIDIEPNMQKSQSSTFRAEN